MNNSEIAALRPGQVAWDDRVMGLHVRASAKKKAFYLSYRTKQREQRRPKIGDVGTVTLPEARDVARGLLAEVAKGGDPMADRRRQELAVRFGVLLDRFVEHIKTDPRDKVRPKTLEQYTLLIKNHLRPRWGSLMADAITRDHVEKMHNDLSATPVIANRCLAVCSRVFNLAEKWGARPAHSNPVRLIDRYPERMRRRLMKGKEAPAISAALDKYELQHPGAVLFLRLLVLTGARPDEISRSRWSDVVVEVDDDGAETWFIVLKESKTSDYIGERIIFLPPAAVDLLRQAPRKHETITGIKSPRWLWHKIRTECGCEDLRLYDLRRTFASAALSRGCSLTQIGEMFGHLAAQTTKRYAWLLESARVTAGTAAAEAIGELMAPRPQKALPAPAKEIT